MQVVYERCAAIDVHQKTAVTTIALTQPNGHLQKETRTFTTMTRDLLQLDDWLQEHGVTVVAMESTGVLWHPIFNILEEGREIILVNAQHMRICARAQDRRQGQRMAGRLVAAWVASSQLYSTEADARTTGADALPQDPGTGTQSSGQPAARSVLEGANLKLAVVATDVLGKSGRDMLDAVVAGEQNAETLAALARGRLRAKLPDLRLALDGRVQPHHRFLLQCILAHLDFLDQSIARARTGDRATSASL